MTHGTCDEVEPLIDREAQGWSESERLRVERHLEGCHDCLAQLTMLRAVRDLVREAPGTLSSAARERAIERALSSAVTAAPVRSERGKVWLAVSVLSAAAVLLLLLLPRQAPLVQKVPPQSAPAAQPEWLEVTHDEQRSFAHAQVQLAAGTRARFDAAQSTLQLERGRVQVAVDARQAAPFRVTTSVFRVEVLGTRFSVTPDSVQVQEGRVQVRALDGQLLARDLGAGTSFSYAPIAQAEPDAPGPALDAAPGVPVLLERARTALTQNNLRLARSLIKRVESGHPQRAELAEAGTLRAELALLEQDTKGALHAYLRVAKQYGELAAGENAAFAAARLAARSDPARERTLLSSYLTRYPRGRFADETRQRLAALSQRP